MAIVPIPCSEKTVVGVKTTHRLADISFSMGDVEIELAPAVARNSIPGPGSKFVMDGKEVEGIRAFTIRWSIHDFATIEVERYIMVPETDKDAPCLSCGETDFFVPGHPDGVIHCTKCGTSTTRG